MHLVQVGCEVNTMTTRFSQTPAHIAAFGGHPDCLLWLLQAGADVNRQDYVGETPIHKAARAGSVACINALLIQGAEPHLRNASGLAAADLAHTQGFWECSQLLSNAQNQLHQLNGVCANGAFIGQGRHLHDGAPNRKRSLEGVECNAVKKARTHDMDSTAGTANGSVERMHVDVALDALLVDNPITVGLTNGCASRKLAAGNRLSSDDRHLCGVPSSWKPLPPPSPPESGRGGPLGHGPEGEGGRRHAADMCGSLHLGGSPSSCVQHRPSWGSGAVATAESGNGLHYGHYHGFGDTAEDLSDLVSGRP